MNASHVKSKAICILGMHRSGTSTVTRAINLLGAYLGEESEMLPPLPDNPEGYWERNDIYMLQDRLLAQLKRMWHTAAPLPNQWHLSSEIRPFREELHALIEKNFSDKPLWAWKDPRCCILMPLWKSIFQRFTAELSCVFVVRNPLDVAKSLRKRDGISLDKSFGIWFNHNIHALQEVVNVPTVFLCYDKFLEGWGPELRRCADALKIDWPTDDLPLREIMDSFIHPNLRHSKSTAEDLKSAPLPVQELYTMLLNQTNSTTTLDACLLTKVNRWTQEFHDYASFFKSDLDDLFITENNLIESYQSLHHLNQVMTKQDQQLAERDQQLAERDQQLVERDQQLAERDRILLEISQQINERDQWIAGLNQAVAELDLRITSLLASASWRITALPRLLWRQTARITDLFQFLINIIRHGGGIRSTAAKVFSIYRQEGWDGIKGGLSQAAIYVSPNVPATVSFFDPIIDASISYDPQHGYSLADGPTSYTYLAPRKPAELVHLIERMDHRPLISILVPVYNTPPDLLMELLDSVTSQWYPHWQLILADDASTFAPTKEALVKIKEESRIIIFTIPSNGGIAEASNAALNCATGEFVALLDHDDVLTEDCLYELALCINRDQPDYIYSDEDKINPDGRFVEPHFKPDWSPDTLMSTMFVCHVSCIRRTLLMEVGGFRSEYDGCQDWDLMLRLTEKTNRISHISKVLYHWRIIPASVAGDMHPSVCGKML